jgi:hypothetical protein
VTPSGGFTAYHLGDGFAARCSRCGWVGPWRGLSLTVVEKDAAEHFDGCSERSNKRAKKAAKSPVDLLLSGRKSSGPRAVRPAGDLADTEPFGGADMATVPRPFAMREGVTDAP